MLLRLDTRQRIRRENVKLYVVVPPVPVFKDSSPIGPGAEPDRDHDRDARLQPEEPAPDGREGPRICPVCNRQVHSFNLQHDTRGRVVGCFICGGDPGYFRG
jgi:hypothetical protein